MYVLHSEEGGEPNLQVNITSIAHVTPSMGYVNHGKHENMWQHVATLYTLCL